MGHLLSKLLAGGLSAGVVLLWWPLVFPSDSVESWLVRGITWTLCFELMLHAFAPLEDSLWRSRAARRVAGRAQAAGSRIGGGSGRARAGLRSVVACVALAVPVALLASAPADRLAPKPAAAQVKHVTQVKRIVRVERRRVAVAPAAGRPAAAALPAASPERTGAQVAATRVPARAATPRRPAAGPHRGAPRRTGPRRPPSPQAGTDAAPPPTPPAPATGPDERSATALGTGPKPRL